MGSGLARSGGKEKGGGRGARGKDGRMIREVAGLETRQRRSGRCVEHRCNVGQEQGSFIKEARTYEKHGKHWREGVERIC